MPGARKHDPQPRESVQISVLVSEDLANRLRRHAARSNVKMGPLVRRWIEAQLEQAETPPRRPKAH